jgi:hypothetical protein
MRGRVERCGLEYPAEEPGIHQNQPVVVDVDLANEVRVEGLEPVPPSGLEAFA